MNRNRLTVAAAALLMGTAAQMAFSAAGWTTYGTVEEVYPTSLGGFYVRMSVTSNPGACLRPEWFFNDASQPGASRVFATLLAAQASSKPVRLYVLGSCELWGSSEFSSASMIN